MIQMLKKDLKAIERFGEKAYPYECCGFLVGSLEEGVKIITAVWPADNERSGEDQRRRYLIEPRAVLEAERRAEREGVQILGIYHSHPDHPGEPSAFDLDHAWPFYAYIIVEVRQGVATKPLCWSLREDRSGFELEEILEV